MPFYEYCCQTCGHEFEKLSKVGDTPPPCPAVQDEPKTCGCETKKLVSGSSFHLKGGGWESDGYS